MNLDSDGEGLSFGILQWAQNRGSLYRLLKVLADANREKFDHLLAANDPGTAQELLNKTENGGKALLLWDGDWPRRFFYTGRDLDFQKGGETGSDFPLGLARLLGLVLGLGRRGRLEGS
jgi:hypothetical protein